MRFGGPINCPGFPIPFEAAATTSLPPSACRPRSAEAAQLEGEILARGRALEPAPVGHWRLRPAWRAPRGLRPAAVAAAKAR